MLAHKLIPIFDPPFAKARNTVPIERPALGMGSLWTSADSTPNFAVSLPLGLFLEGDILRLQIQAASGGWTSLYVNSTHTITAGEIAGGDFGFGLSALGNGDYEATLNYTRGVEVSNWAAPIPFTIAAAVNNELYVYPYLAI